MKLAQMLPLPLLLVLLLIIGQLNKRMKLQLLTEST